MKEFLKEILKENGDEYISKGNLVIGILTVDKPINDKPVEIKQIKDFDESEIQLMRDIAGENLKKADLDIEMIRVRARGKNSPGYWSWADHGVESRYVSELGENTTKTGYASIEFPEWIPYEMLKNCNRNDIITVKWFGNKFILEFFPFYGYFEYEQKK